MHRRELYKHNPRQYPREELEATFVAREAILDDILSELRARAAEPVNQHILITGPRGIGKTNLLLLIRYRVQDDMGLSRSYQAIQTAEEEYSISSLRDLFTRILEILNEESPDQRIDNAIKEIDTIDNDEIAAERAIETAESLYQRSNRKILLLIDNLDLILGDQLNDEAELGRFRDILMNRPFLVLVGAAPTYFEEVSGYGRPFYQFFRRVDLNELSADQMFSMLRKRAEWDGNQNLIQRFGEQRHRIDQVHHLTGGNPRLALMLYQICTANEIPEVRAAVQTLLDDVTPYYKHRIEQLPAQQRKVLDTFARLGRPATPSELALDARLPQNQVTSILTRLRDNGLVTIAPQKRRRKTYYMISERLFRIWHQMRFSTGKRRLEFLVDFIRIWFTPDEWKCEADRILEAYRRTAREKRLAESERHLDHLYYLTEGAPSPKQRAEIVDQTILTCIEERDYDHAAEILKERRKIADQKGDREHLAQVWFLTAFLRDEQGLIEEAIEALKIVVDLDPGGIAAYFNWGTALGRLADEKEGSEREELIRQAIDKFERALQIKPDEHDALYNWGNALRRLAEFKEDSEREELLRQAIDKFERALQINPDMHEAINNLGTTLWRLANIKEGLEREELLRQAIDNFERALQIKPDKHEALYNWGTALGRLADEKEGSERDELLRQAIYKFERALQIKPDMYKALYNWGNALRRLADVKEGSEREELLRKAIDKFERAIQINPDIHEAFNNLGTTLRRLADVREGSEREELLRKAIDKFERALQIKPDKHDALYNLGNVLIRLAEINEGSEREKIVMQAISKYQHALQIMPDKHRALLKWGDALRELAVGKEGAEKEKLLCEGIKKVEEAIRTAQKAGDTDSCPEYISHLIGYTLTLCAIAVNAGNFGEARATFEQVIREIPRARKELIHAELIDFFFSVASEDTAFLCGEFLKKLSENGFERETGLLEPFSHAINYWTADKDADEVLDRLNPEVRELVEKIIRHERGM